MHHLRIHQITHLTLGEKIECKKMMIPVERITPIAKLDLKFSAKVDFI